MNDGRSRSALALLLLLVPAGCAASNEPSYGRTGGDKPSFEDFEATAYREPDTGIYIVDGDVPLEGIDELRRYWALLGDGSALTVNAVGGVHDLWSDAAKRNLTYCVSDQFGVHKPTVVANMAAAGRAWSTAMDVTFSYRPAQDATCTPSNTNVVFDVRPASGGALAVAFHPHMARSSRSLLIFPAGLAPTFPLTPTGVLRHELGHALGFRHEHIRVSQTSANCQETGEHFALTQYDARSVMHYPWCNGANTGDLVLTPTDRAGGVIAYGPPRWTTSPWTIEYADPQGWGADGHWSTIRYADLDGDGRLDVCGSDAGGMRCAKSTGTAFTAPSLWTGEFGSATGWTGSPSHYDTIRLVDVNGDRKADVCGRASTGIQCALSSGRAFQTPQVWTSEFGDAGWSTFESNWATISFPDINGDHRADVCGRASFGIVCALSTGGSFTAPSVWTLELSDAAGWAALDAYWGTIRFPDVNGDGKADVCGRAGEGIYCALSTGTAFGSFTRWTSSFADAGGWATTPAFWQTIQFIDLNGDGRADVCGRNDSGISCGFSTGAAFGAVTLWSSAYGDAAGWGSTPAYWRTISFPDLNADGKADVCGRGTLGLQCATTAGSSFGAPTLRSPTFADTTAFADAERYYRTIAYPDLDGDGDADVCGRSPVGLLCAP